MRNQALAAALLAAAFSGTARAQLVVNSNMTPEELVNQVLLGGGVSVSNITFNGAAGTALNEQIGSFDGTGSNIGIGEGIIFASGSVQGAVGPNNAGGYTEGGGHTDQSDPDLETIVGSGGVTDAAVLEFDFVPSGDSVKFSYVFASDEYPEYVCDFNDAFGFFLSGPGITGPYTNNAINIALVPNTTMPVTIDNVNNGFGNDPDFPGCNAVNPEYYVINGEGFDEPYASDPYYVQYDGFTRVLEARAHVQCGMTYHIKLAVGDAGNGFDDTAFDSGVFLQAGSFASTPFIPGLVPGPGIVGDTLFESCFPVQLAFIRVSDPTVTDTVHIAVSGTATAGEDYSPALPTEIIFHPGETEVPFAMMAPVDPDGTETVVITVFTHSPCTDEVFSEDFEFFIRAAHPVIAIGSAESIACGDSVLLTPTVTGGYGLYNYVWPSGETVPSIWASPDQDSDVTVQITDTCGIVTQAYFAVGIESPAALTATLIGPEDMVEGCSSSELVVDRPAGMGGDLQIVFTYEGQITGGADLDLPSPVLMPSGQNSITVPVVPVNDGIAEGTETFIIHAGYMMNACGQSGSDAVSGTISDAPPIELQAEDLIQQPCGQDSLPINAQASGGVGSLTYAWSTGATGPGTWVQGYYDDQYVVTVTDDCGHESAATILVDVLCDLLVPNVITPNGDGSNDRWIIPGIQASRNTVRIYNRWGNAVFEARDYRNTWTPPSSLPDGTYFFEITLESQEKPITGTLTIMANRR